MEKKEMKKINNWAITANGNLVAENIGYKKVIEYCEILYLAEIEDIKVEFLGEDKIYVFGYDYNLDEVILVDEEDY